MFLLWSRAVDREYSQNDDDHEMMMRLSFYRYLYLYPRQYCYRCDDHSHDIGNDTTMLCYLLSCHLTHRIIKESQTKTTHSPSTTYVLIMMTKSILDATPTFTVMLHMLRFWHYRFLLLLMMIMVYNDRSIKIVRRFQLCDVTTKIALLLLLLLVLLMSPCRRYRFWW